MTNIAPEEKKGKLPGVDTRSKAPALNELGRANIIALENKAILTK